MRTILGLLGVVGLVIIAVLAWNWWAGNTTQLTILSPAADAELAGNTVPVRLGASPDLREKLTSTKQVQIITYLDGKEVARGEALEYNLTSVAPGEHRLEIGLTDTTKAEAISLRVMPQPVSFTLGGGSGANNSLPPASNSLNGVYGSQPSAPDANIPQPVPTATPVAPQVPAAPAPTQAPVQLPASGMGGGSNAVANTNAGQANAVQSINVANENANQAAQAGSQTSFNIASTKPNTQAVVAAETARPAAQPADPLSAVFQGMLAFYVAGFVVGLGLIFYLKRRKRSVF